jgi:tungstate transport system ATP-binding protein
MTACYEISQIRFSYDMGRRACLAIDNFQIGSGEFVALLGPNGSGKTTLLHVLAFLNIPQQGFIRFNGEILTKKNALALRRRVGLLLQNPYLFNTTVLENVMSGLRLRGVQKSRAAPMAKDALTRVGLAGFEERFARNLSGGEAQRVALARTLVLDPDVLLLDEPSNHMDVESVRITDDIVLDWNKKRGKTVVMATHHQSDIRCHVDTICWLDGGRIRTS